MKMEYFYLILILGLIFSVSGQSGEEQTATDEPLPSVPAKTVDPGPPRKCIEPGMMCVDCNTQAICIGDSGGTTYNRISRKCNEGEVCLAGVCSKDNLCNYRPFQCSQPTEDMKNVDGLFPDPWDCTKYHFCLPPTDNGSRMTQLDFECAAGSSFDPSTSACDSLLDTKACRERPVSECLEPLQTGEVKSEPSIFYVCTVKDGTLSHEFFHCSAGQTFIHKKTSCSLAKKKKSKF